MRCERGDTPNLAKLVPHTGKKLVYLKRLAADSNLAQPLTCSNAAATSGRNELRQYFTRSC